MSAPEPTRLRARRTAAVVVIAVLALAGCGGGGGVSDRAASSLPASLGVDHGPEFFNLPSRNIGCGISSSGVRCDIVAKVWSAPPPPRPCNLDYGSGIVLDNVRADFVCAADAVGPDHEVLQYGLSAQRGSFRCDSAVEGVTCRQFSTGHGFFMSRESYRLF